MQQQCHGSWTREKEMMTLLPILTTRIAIMGKLPCGKHAKGARHHVSRSSYHGVLVGTLLIPVTTIPLSTLPGKMGLKIVFLPLRYAHLHIFALMNLDLETVLLMHNTYWFRFISLLVFRISFSKSCSNYCN